MNDQPLVLNALLRLARRRVPASLAELEARLPPNPQVVGSARIRSALAHLSAQGLVRYPSRGAALAQLTLEGLAVAVALAGSVASRRARPATARSSRRAA